MMKKILLTACILGINIAAIAQANFWNLNGSYMDCNTGGAGTLSTTSYPLHLYQSDASSFPVPGLCETYCKLDYTPHEGKVITYKLVHITEYVSPSIPGFSSGSYNLSLGTIANSDNSSIAAAKLNTDRTRDIYAQQRGQIIKVANISANGAITNSPTVLYTLPGAVTPNFDRWTGMEVSSDGKYILLVGPDALTLKVYNIATGTVTSYPAPGGGSNRIQGFEYVSMSPSRIYVTYNNRSAANPSGTGGVAYYTVGNTSTYATVTNAIGFGFSEIEMAKNGKLHLANAGSNPAYNFTGAGTVYALSLDGTLTATAFTVPASNNASYGALCNKYYIQTQIDGEDYDAGSYTASKIVGTSVKLKGYLGWLGPKKALVIKTCTPHLLPFDFTLSGMTSGYELTITRGTISDDIFTADPVYTPIVYTRNNYYSSNVSGQIIPSSTDLSSWRECDWKIQIRPIGTCSGSGTTHTVYYRLRNPDVTATGSSIQGKNGYLTPSYSSTPTLTFCETTPLALNFMLGGAATGYDVKITKGIINTGDVFTAAAAPNNVTQSGSSGPSGVSLSLRPSSFVPADYIGSDWKVEITPKSACGSGSTYVTYYKTRNVSILADYYANRSTPSGSGITTNKKDLQTTLPISSTMPSGSTYKAFNTAVALATGWTGASSAGVSDINIDAGANWVLRVYEVDDTSGIRKKISGVDVPDACYFAGNEAHFNKPFSECSRGFNSANASTGFVDTNTTYEDGHKYFYEYYQWAESVSSAALTAFSAITWCTELTVTDALGCTVSKKSFFRIASASNFSNGENARPGRNDNDNEVGEFDGNGYDELRGIGNKDLKTSTLKIYPNPINTLLNIVIPSGTTNASLQIIDNIGRVMLENTPLQSGENSINIKQLPAGVYFYKILINGKVSHGKIVKQ